MDAMVASKAGSFLVTKERAFMRPTPCSALMLPLLSAAIPRVNNQQRDQNGGVHTCPVVYPRLNGILDFLAVLCCANVEVNVA